MTEKKQQDDFLKDTKKSGLRTLALTPIQWVTSTFTTTALAGSLTVQALLATSGKTAITLGVGAGLALGMGAWNKMRDARAASKQMVKDRADGKDPDTPALEKFKETDESLGSLGHRVHGLLATTSRFARKANQRLTNVEQDTAALKAAATQPTGVGPEVEQQFQAMLETALAAERARNDAVREQDHQTIVQLKGELAEARATIPVGTDKCRARRSTVRVGAGRGFERVC
ncbi:hypothetical protein [Fodinicola feengrottensis]|uniref:hypothetical protein n=1 Tax=Fodinicola feengrottensis TaxID=435914 RepID=UPI0013D6BF92|nr:hypothetical protein [Fodinicola feengrottensis]